MFWCQFTTTCTGVLIIFMVFNILPLKIWLAGGVELNSWKGHKWSRDSEVWNQARKLLENRLRQRGCIETYWTIPASWSISEQPINILQAVIFFSPNVAKESWSGSVLWSSAWGTTCNLLCEWKYRTSCLSWVVHHLERGIRDSQWHRVHSEQVLNVSVVVYEMCGSAVYLVSSFPGARSRESGCVKICCSAVFGKKK